MPCALFIKTSSNPNTSPSVSPSSTSSSWVAEFKMVCALFSLHQCMLTDSADQFIDQLLSGFFVVIRKLVSRRGWRPSTSKDSSWAAPCTRTRGRRRKTYVVWIVARRFAPTACGLTTATGLCRYGDTFTMTSSGFRTSTSSSTAPVFRLQPIKLVLF